jgi:hypothetical protein
MVSLYTSHSQAITHGYPEVHGMFGSDELARKLGPQVQDRYGWSLSHTSQAG